MRVQFQNENLKELYRKGSSRKYKNVPTQVVPGYKIEKLANSERYSMRMNVQWRLELTITWTDENKVSVDVVNLVELSKHYGD